MAKVGCVAHQEFGQGAQQFVKAEDFDRVEGECKALQATVGWSRAQHRKLSFYAMVMTVVAGALACGFYLLWQGCGV